MQMEKYIYLANIPRALRMNSVVWHSVNQLSLTDHRPNERTSTSEIAEYTTSSSFSLFNGCTGVYVSMRIQFIHRHSSCIHAWSTAWRSVCVCVCGVLPLLMCAIPFNVAQRKNTLLLLLAHWFMLTLIYNLSQCITNGGVCSWVHDSCSTKADF